MTYKFIDDSGKELPHVVIEGKYYVHEVVDTYKFERDYFQMRTGRNLVFKCFDSGNNYNAPIIATNDPTLGLPLIELEKDLTECAIRQVGVEGWGEYEGTSEQVGIRNSYIAGYLKAKKAYKFTEEDIVNAFAEGHARCPKDCGEFELEEKAQKYLVELQIKTITVKTNN
jgi:hypothetical protein